MRIRHIIWDWNGTLINDLDLTVDLLNQRLVKDQLPTLTLDEFRERMTFPVSKFYTDLGYHDEKFRASVMHEWFLDYEAQKHICPLHAGVESLIPAARAKNVSHSILSAHLHEAILHSLDEHTIRDHFEYVVGATAEMRGVSKVERGKTLCHDLLQKNGIHKHEIVLVGDSSHDWEVAHALEVSCVLVSHGVFSAKRLGEHGVPVVDSLNAVFETIETL